MKLLFLFGDSAVGKMTVGQELSKMTGLRLFHNHVTIEPVLEVFGCFDTHVIDRLRDVIFEEFAKSDHYGMVFTFVWAFDEPEDWEKLERVKSIFRPYDTEFYYVELVASQEVRLIRNTTENRLDKKPSKRNLEFSEKLLLESDEKHRHVSHPGEIPFKNYFKIDNTYLTANETALMIKHHFGFEEA